MLAARAAFARLGRLAATADSRTVLRTSSCLFSQSLRPIVFNCASTFHDCTSLRVSAAPGTDEQKKQGDDVAATAACSPAQNSATIESAHSNPLASVPGATLSQSDKMVIMYTCRVCDTRSARTISKPSYQSGVVLVRCPGCNKLHLIADRLGYFGDESADVESLLAARGERVKRSSMVNGFSLAAAPPAGSAAAAAVSSTSSPPSASASLSADGSGDAFVLEFSAEDLAVLRSSSKSINLRTQVAVGAAAARAAGATAGGKPDSG